MDKLTAVEETFLSMGITRRYKGYEHACFCILHAMEDEGCLKSAKKNIYTAAAEHFGCKWNLIERNIRTISSRSWKARPDLLCKMAGRELTSEPTAAEFVDIVTIFLLQKAAAQSQEE